MPGVEVAGLLVMRYTGNRASIPRSYGNEMESHRVLKKPPKGGFFVGKSQSMTASN
jgi:hypothetical protein